MPIRAAPSRCAFSTCPASSSRDRTRSRSSAAAFTVNVVAMTASGRTGALSLVIAFSSSSTRRYVFPLPALAEIR